MIVPPHLGAWYPPSSSADLGWIQHRFAPLKKTGRMAVVLDTGAVSRGCDSKYNSINRYIARARIIQE
nr:N-6 DNA methylase [uncultured Methanoregula sp.]